MSIFMKMKLQGSPSEASRRKSNLARATLASLWLVIFATGASLLFIRSSSHRPVAEREISPAVAAGARDSQEAKPDSSAAVIPHVAGQVGKNTATEIKPRNKTPNSPIEVSSRPAQLRQQARKRLEQKLRARSHGPASATVASEGVFRTSSLQPVAPQRNPVFSILQSPPEMKEQAAPAATKAEREQQPSQSSSVEQTSKNIEVAAIEARVDVANLPQAKPPVEKIMLIPSTGPGEPAAEAGAPAPQPTAQPQTKGGALPPGVEALSYDLEKISPAEFNGDVRNLPQVASVPKVEPDLKEPVSSKQPPAPGQIPDAPNNIPLAPMPSPIQNFAGLSRTDSCTGGPCGSGFPPDINGDVGPNHYIEAVNSAYAIYNKTGALLASFTENSLWSGAGTGTPCDANNQGDPVVVYDQFGDRWFLTHFAFATSGGNPIAPFYQCFAVSKTSDPVAGGWWLYAVKMDTGAAGQPPAGTLNDYPKFGNWNDGCLYMGANGFLAPGFSFNGTIFASFSKSNMESGAPLTAALGFIANNTDPFTMVPSNISGAKGSSNVPPAGTPNYFVSESQVAFTFEVRKFTPGANCSGGTLGAAVNVSQTSYVGFGGTNVPQPNTANTLDWIGDRIMQKVQYRRVGAAESLWVVHNVEPTSTSTSVRPQWAQINVTGGTVVTTPVQQQIYAPDTTIWRWMGSIAADHVGNVAVGYSTSNATSPNFPGVAYSGRLVGDPLNNLSQTEVQLIAGGGSQTNNCGGAPCHRWGDYTAMSVDPVDDCTFWYTSEYYDTQTNGTAGNWRTRIGSFKFPSCSTPTEAKVKTFTADGFDDGRVLLQWSSSHEVDNLGYNVYRETNGRRTKINPQTIAGSALVTGPKVALTAGKAYAWGDQMTQTATRYWLEDIDLNGKSTWTGPVALNAKRGAAPSFEQSVLLTRIGMASMQMTVGQGSVPVERKAGIPSLSPETIKVQTDLAGEQAVKLSVKQEGWYRITQQDLAAAGLSSKVDARNLQLYVDGKQVPMIVNGEQDGRLDPSDSIEFYGVGLNSAATNAHVYWLVAGEQNGARINMVKAAGGQPAPGSFVAAVERKDRTLYFSALRNGDAENFFGPVVAGAPVDQSLTLTNVASTSSPATLDVYLQGVTQTPHQAQVTLNGAVLGAVSFNGQERGKASFPIAQSQLREGVNSVQLMALGGSSDISLVDTVRVSYMHTLNADSNQLRASVKGGQPVTIGGFTSSDIRVMDVTDLNNPQELIGAINRSKSNSSITLTPPGGGTRALLAFNGASAMSASAKANVPSNWRQEGLQYDYLMITTQDLKSSLGPLKALRESEGLSVAIVDVEDLYDEFSFGNKSPQAIKDFLQYTRDNWRRLPRFVLFAGDSSYDPKNYLGFGDLDLVPTKLFDSAFMEAASDDWFSDFQATGLPDIASGRLPVRNATEAAALVGKILSYESSAGANSVLLTEDLNDGHNFAAAGAALRTLLPLGMDALEIVRGESDDATVKSRILAAINQGKTIVNYNGHGSVNQWRGNILTNADAAGMTNSQKLAFFVMMTCLNGYFDDPVLDSLAESLLKASGGAAAVWASAAQCEPGPQELLNQELYRLLFSGGSITIGEAAARAKQAVTDGDVRRSWILFGDPAMRLK